MPSRANPVSKRPSAWKHLGQREQLRGKIEHHLLADADELVDRRAGRARRRCGRRGARSLACHPSGDLGLELADRTDELAGCPIARATPPRRTPSSAISAGDGPSEGPRSPHTSQPHKPHVPAVPAPPTAGTVALPTTVRRCASESCSTRTSRSMTWSKTAKSLSDAGFDTLWCSQIFAYDALTLLAVIGRELPGVGLGTFVVPVYPRHPVVLAAQALTVQSATRNRLQLGIGLSHQVLIENVFGQSFDRPASLHERVPRDPDAAPARPSGRLPGRGAERRHSGRTRDPRGCAAARAACRARVRACSSSPAGRPTGRRRG